eukprot:GFUD01039332.1.p1 GENE.GFUD01039332.1~~GFUD01039332.1.p1  ORF type:complete len:253 (-),score=78.61 GFUD01039332.1:68-826(-)
MGAKVSRHEIEVTAADDAHEEDKSDSEVIVVKKTFAGRLRSKILRGEPLSASTGLDRTPIAVQSSCETPVKMLLGDPRSPGMWAGDVGVERTPLLVTQKREDRQEGRLNGKGVIPPAFSLPIPIGEDTLQLLDSGDPRSPAPGLLEPRTPITSIPPTKTDDQPASLLQVRLREAASVAMKDTVAGINSITPSATTTMKDTAAGINSIIFSATTTMKYIAAGINSATPSATIKDTAALAVSTNTTPAAAGEME